MLLGSTKSVVPEPRTSDAVSGPPRCADSEAPEVWGPHHLRGHPRGLGRAWPMEALCRGFWFARAISWEGKRRAGAWSPVCSLQSRTPQFKFRAPNGKNAPTTRTNASAPWRAATWLCEEGGWGGGATPPAAVAKLVRSLGKISCAAACFYLHMWVPTLLWQIELTCKRRHAQHWWAELITFTIRIVCSGFVDIHHSQMAQSVVAHMQTVLCLDVAHQTERSLNMASRAWSSDKENSKADRHMNAKKMDAAACCGMLQNPHVQLQKKGAAACCGCTCLAVADCIRVCGLAVERVAGGA